MGSPDGYEAVIKRYFQILKSEIEPDLVFAHFLEDCHQDHRILAGFTWNTFRNQIALRHEPPKYESDLRHPNFLVPLGKRIRDEKGPAYPPVFPDANQ